MKLSLTTDAPSKVRVDLLGVPVVGPKFAKSDIFQSLDKATGGALSSAAKLDDFRGKPGESLRVQVQGIEASIVLLVGVAEQEDPRAFAVKVAQAGARYASIALVWPGTESPSVARLAEGLLTGTYKFTRYLTGDRLPKTRTSSAKILVTKSLAKADAMLEKGRALAESINFARDLVNAPPNDLTPTALADAAKSEGSKHGLSIRVWDKRGLEKLGAHLFLAVNRGSAEEPRMVHMTWKPKNARKGTKKVVFVGKGLTFDSGGLCIKPGKSMVDMKCDMAGAATTIGTMLACARLNLPLEVHGLFGATENMTGSAAYRPGDVFPTLEGKTVEIINTDAEGRLVLADVLTYAARELAPDYLIDHATLTGACMVALGPWTAGLFSNDDELANAYRAASQRAREPFWQMPLDSELRESLKSDIADLKHVGDAYGGSITAALFLREFVGETKWLHLDIAGPAFLDRPHAQYPKGGTGFGVATAIEFLEGLTR